MTHATDGVAARTSASPFAVVTAPLAARQRSAPGRALTAGADDLDRDTSMADPIVITGDSAVFPTSCGGATLPPVKAPMSGSGRDTVQKKAVCVDGDERKVMVSGVSYTTSTHTIPGTGSLMIQALADSQKSKKAKSGGKPVLIAKGKFTAKFMVMVPAQQPSSPNPIPDNTIQYVGQGEFETTNQKANLGG